MNLLKDQQKDPAFAETAEFRLQGVDLISLMKNMLISKVLAFRVEMHGLEFLSVRSHLQPCHYTLFLNLLAGLGVQAIAEFGGLGFRVLLSFVA